MAASIGRTCPLLILFALTLLFSNSHALDARQTSAFDSAPPKTASAQTVTTSLPAIDREVRADMAFLADDALHGRGSATRDEHIAALFAAAQFQSLGLAPGGDDGSFIQKIAVSPEQLAAVRKRMAHYEDTDRSETWNAVGILRGTEASGEAILLSAHLDHLGVGPANASGDTIYNGADDDASGTTAVLALAHAVAADPRPRRTIVFALFGSEELGGFGNAGFLSRPPVPLASIVANLAFEMIGRSDPVVPDSDSKDTLWLTGFDRSSLGPELARHGAHLVADPHPAEKFFQRSDNFALARQGIVAHTVSSFGLHKDYHQPSDDLAAINFPHMVNAIASMVAPIRWLADTTWKPAWNPGGRP
jgi:hypothetical protein